MKRQDGSLALSLGRAPKLPDFREEAWGSDLPREMEAVGVTETLGLPADHALVSWLRVCK